MQIKKRQLIKDWVQYLKNNKIVSTKSKAGTGELSYNRKPTTSDLLKFLQVKTDFSDDILKKAIRQAIKQTSEEDSDDTTDDSGIKKSTMVNPVTGDSSDKLKTSKMSSDNTDDLQTIWQKEIGGPENKLSLPGKSTTSVSVKNKDDVSVNNRNRNTDVVGPGTNLKHREDDLQTIKGPEQISGPRGISGPKQKAIKHKPKFQFKDVDDIEDVDYEELAEAIRDRPGRHLEDITIATVFDILVNLPKGQDKASESEVQSDEDLLFKKQEELRKIKRVIRDQMTDAQRKSLWRALND